MDPLPSFILLFLFVIHFQHTTATNKVNFEELLARFRKQGFRFSQYGKPKVTPPPASTSRPSPRFDVSPTVPPETTPCHQDPGCPPVHLDKFMSMDGTCNNRVNKNTGRAVRTLKRLLTPDYSDQTGRPRSGKFNGALPQPRAISTALSRIVARPSPMWSHLVPFWGQFIVHDIALTPVTERNADGSEVHCDCENPSLECINIPIPRDDEQYREEKKSCFTLKRSLPVANSNTLNCDSSVRQQMNKLSGYIDGGTIYGNTQGHRNALMDRASGMGLLVKSTSGVRGHPSNSGSMLPLQTEVSNASIAQTMECPAIHKPAGTPCFVSGDVRANENSALISQHTFWMRHHNSIAATLKKLNPTWNTEVVFKNTRQIISSLMQMITYGHFLPLIVGPQHMERFGLNLLRKGYWHGYDSTYDATVSNAFTTAAFRMGHSLIGAILSRPSPSWRTRQGEDVSLKSSFFSSEPIFNSSSGGSNSVLRGLLKEQAQSVDTRFTNDLRNFLFAEKGHYGHDLLSMNIQRGRDHGIPSYNQYRKFCGLRAAEDFDDLKEIPVATQKQLKVLYRHVDDIDLYVGGISENHVKDGSVGPTFACIISYQFRDLKRGDRFWHENGGVFQTFREDQLRALRSASYPGLLCDGIPDMQTVQPYPMILESNRNRRRPCQSYSRLDLTPWQENRPIIPDNDVRVPPDAQWTSWFPSTTRTGSPLSASETLSLLLIYRPDDVCNQVLETETRYVNRNFQVRFQCPAGSIKSSDFPAVDSDTMVWNDWQDVSTPSRYGSDVIAHRPRGGCSRPMAIQVQTVEGVPARETGEVFEDFSVISGFACRGKDQTNGRCSDYRVRYLCRQEVVRRVPTPYPTRQPTLRWSDWVSVETNGRIGDREFLSRARQLTDICRNPIRIEARTVKGGVPYTKTGDVIRRVDTRFGFACYNSEQKSKRCEDYEVRYLCPDLREIPTTRRH